MCCLLKLTSRAVCAPRVGTGIRDVNKSTKRTWEKPEATIIKLLGKSSPMEKHAQIILNIIISI